MHSKYLGDSHDFVKRLWADVLRRWAPLYVKDQYIEGRIRKEYTLLTGIPMLSLGKKAEVYSVLYDADKGIRLPGGPNQGEGRKYVRIATMLEQLKDPRCKCVVAYEQSIFGTVSEQAEERKAKQECLKDFQTLYYPLGSGSRAAFVFVLRTPEDSQELKQLMANAGIPTRRLAGLEVAEPKAEPPPPPPPTNA